MIEIDAIAKIISNGLRSDLDDVLEKKQIDEHDAIRRGEIMVIPCRHHPTITHTNGDVECLVCHEMLKEKIPKRRNEK